MTPVWIELDLSALRHNVRWVDKRVGGVGRIWAVIKANGYGHGARELGKVLESTGVAGLAVVSLEEALELRESKVRAPILLLNPGTANEAPWVVRHDLTQALSTREMLLALSRAARAAGRFARVHVKVDTGMSRLGVPFPEAVEFIGQTMETPGIACEGLLSHLATADGSDSRFARLQVQRMREIFEALPVRARRKLKSVHIANSATVTLWPQGYRHPFNAVRPGLVLYGGQPVGGTVLPLQPVMQVKARVECVKEIQKGTGIGYGHTFHAPRRMRVATIGMGYSHGFSRGLSNKGELLLGGRRCPVVGRVCMDHVMVDVSASPTVESGEEAVIIGAQGRERITLEDHAKWLGTIPYVVSCGMNSRFPRKIVGQAVSL